MLIYESDDNPFWIMYPGGCHALLPYGDWLVNDRSCTLNTLIRVAVAVRERDNSSQDSASELADRASEKWRTDPDIKFLWRSSLTTHQGLTLELIRYQFEYDDGTPGTAASAFYIHDDALFQMSLRYATEYKTENAPIVDFALNSFTILE